MADDASFARLVSLACHDLRTPLATAFGFARTLGRLGGLDERQERYVGMIEAAAGQMTELLDELGLLARIEGGRWEPNIQEADSLALAQDAAAHEAVAAEVRGDGAPVQVDGAATVRALRGLAVAAIRHGPVERLTIEVSGPDILLGPVTEAARPVLVGGELREFGAVAGRMVVEALGGSVVVDGRKLVVSLPG